MNFTRRQLLAALPAAVAASVVPICNGGARGAFNETRSIKFTPALALKKAERERHEHYMKMAINLAQTLPGPFAAVIVDRRKGEVICQGKNKYEENPIFHGEIVAIDNCAKLKPRVEWRDLTLYTTAESCPMCQSAIVWTGISQAVYGTSIEDLIQFGIHQIRLDSPTVAAAAPFYSGSIVGGVLKDRTDDMYRKWAQSRRK